MYRHNSTVMWCAAWSIVFAVLVTEYATWWLRPAPPAVAQLAATRSALTGRSSVIDGDTLRITRVQPLVAGADSLAVSAQASLEACGPPLWQGTVHTHIALMYGERPYERFSGSDRGVMQLWWRRWKQDGMFCVLYTPRDAYCEVDGSSIMNMGRSDY